MKPKLFVGSSVEGLSIAYAVQQNLEYQSEVTVWNQGIFHLSNTALDSLIEVLDRSDFGIFLFTPDDIVNIRGEQNKAVRDNVLFELGLFVGRLGKRRSFILMPREQKDFHLPTDLIGMTPGTYETDRADGNFKAATGPVCHEMSQLVSSLGPLSKSSERPERPQSSDQGSKPRIIEEDQAKAEEANVEKSASPAEPNWLEAFSAGQYDDAISLLEKKIAASEDDDEKLSFEVWIGRVKAKTDLAGALEYLNKLKERNPERDDPYSGIAFAYSEKGLIDEALAALDVGISAAKEKQWLSWFKANMLKRDGRVSEALQVLSDLSQESPGFNLGYSTAAEILEEQGRKDDATSMYEQGLKNSPSNESLLYGYGQILIDTEKNEAALTVFMKLLAMSPENRSYLAYLGNIYLNLGLNGLALESYQKANRLAEEKEQWIVANIGNLLNNQGFHAFAIEYLQKAISLDSNSAYAHERLSTAIKRDEEERKKATEIVRKHRESLRPPADSPQMEQ
jgi:tetratricopeptide (TPR) repeat protein